MSSTLQPTAALVTLLTQLLQPSEIRESDSETSGGWALRATTPSSWISTISLTTDSLPTTPASSEGQRIQHHRRGCESPTFFCLMLFINQIMNCSIIILNIYQHILVFLNLSLLLFIYLSNYLPSLLTNGHALVLGL